MYRHLWFRAPEGSPQAGGGGGSALPAQAESAPAHPAEPDPPEGDDDPFDLLRLAMDDTGLEDFDDPADPPAPPSGGEAWQAPVRELAQSLEGFKLQVLGLLGQRSAAPAAPVAPAAPKAGLAQKLEALRDQPELVNQLLPHLIDEAVQEKIADMAPRLRADLQREQQTGQLDQRLGKVVSGLSDELRRPGPLVQTAQELHTQLSHLLRNDLVGTPLHDKLAFALAASENPRLVAKRVLASARTQNASRKAAADRLGQLGFLAGGTGGGQLPRGGDATITDRDRELAERFDLNLEDPAVKARLLASKKSARLGALTGSSLIGEVR